MAAYHDEDVNNLAFGPDFASAEFLSNAHVCVLLDALNTQKYKASGKRAPEAFAKSLAYSQVNLGAVVVRDAAAIDDLFDQMKALEFDREDDAGGLSKARLEAYQIVALANLNPGTVLAARSLVPSLAIFNDEEVGEMLAILRRSSAKHMG